MATIASIAAKALDKVALKVTDAAHSATITDGTTTSTGRAVVDKLTPSKEFSKFSAGESAQLILLEGFDTSPADGWSLTFNSRDYLVIRVQDILAAGSLFYVQAIAEADLYNVQASIQALTKTPDGMGGNTEAWSTPDAVGGYLEGLSGSEKWQAMRVSPDNRYRLIIAYQVGVTAADRVLIGSKYYGIESVMDMSGRGVWLELTPTEGAP